MDSDGGNSSGVKESLSSDDHAASGSSTLRPLHAVPLKGYGKCKQLLPYLTTLLFT